MSDVGLDEVLHLARRELIISCLQSPISFDWVPLTPQPAVSLSSSRISPTQTVSPTAATCRRGEQTRLRPPAHFSLASLAADLAVLGALLWPRHVFSPGPASGQSVPAARQERHLSAGAINSITTPRLVSRLSDPERSRTQERDDSQCGGQSRGQSGPSL